jgi:hypothetical protein
VPGARKKFKGKEKRAVAKCQEQGKILREREGSRSEVPGARKEFRGKKTEAVAKCSEQGNNLEEKRRKQKQSATSKERN